jgi:hypothetical protein
LREPLHLRGSPTIADIEDRLSGSVFPRTHCSPGANLEHAQQPVRAQGKVPLKLRDRQAT